jgi:hypothetical protein
LRGGLVSDVYFFVFRFWEVEDWERTSEEVVCLALHGADATLL